MVPMTTSGSANLVSGVDIISVATVPSHIAAKTTVATRSVRVDDAVRPNHNSDISPPTETSTTPTANALGVPPGFRSMGVANDHCSEAAAFWVKNQSESGRCARTEAATPIGF